MGLVLREQLLQQGAQRAGISPTPSGQGLCVYGWRCGWVEGACTMLCAHRAKNAVLNLNLQGRKCRQRPPITCYTVNMY